MKKTILALTLFSTHSFATIDSDKTITTALWEAPMVPSISLSIKATEDFRKSCQAITSLAKRYLDSGDIEFVDQAYFERLRTQPIEYSYPNDKFASFYLNKETQNGYISFEVINNKKTKSSLPHFEQAKSIQFINISDIEASEFEVIGQARSLTSLAKEMGLLESTIKTEYNHNNGLVLTVLTKDLACDLIEGRVQIQVKSQAEITLPSDSLEQLKRFYQSDLLKEMNPVLKQSDLTIKKQAYLLGHKVGALLERELESQDQKLVEASLIELMEKLFKLDSFTPIAPLAQTTKGLQLWVAPEAKVMMTLKLGIK